ncbi:MAG TPA: hypothetical protein VGY48_12515 [Vicinamibacterales bacterium]|nr:hypothetical protein [Vicinamibacterales bacterium]
MAAEQVFIGVPPPSFGGKVVAIPNQFPTDADTNLQIISSCSIAGVTLGVNGRRIDDQGRVVSFVETHTPNSDRSNKVQNILLGGGALLHLTVFAITGNPTIGQCFVIVRLIQGLAGPRVLLATLGASYVTNIQALGYPGSPIKQSIDGPGAIRFLDFGGQASGVDWFVQVPTGARWQVLSLFAQITCGAGGGNRAPAFAIGASGSEFVIIPATVIVTGGNVGSFIWSVGIGYAVAALNVATATGIPNDLPVPAGQFVATKTLNLAGNDQWFTVRLIVREWLEVS